MTLDELNYHYPKNIKPYSLSVKERYPVALFSFCMPRFWSVPHQRFLGSRLIENVLANPSFFDILAVVTAFGFSAVKPIWQELKPTILPSIADYTDLALGSMSSLNGENG